MNQQGFDWTAPVRHAAEDVCARHHGGNPESAAAFEAIYEKLPELRRKVLFAVRDLGLATVKDVVDKTGLARLTVGARLTELKQAGLIEPTDITRDGCRVLRIVSISR